MNFLEELTAEWYEYNGYFVRQNVKFGKNFHGKGGHEGEMDVIAYNPNTDEFLHIETSTDSDTRAKREMRFKRKFKTARVHYPEIFPFKGNHLRQIAIVSFNNSLPPDLNFGDGVEIMTIPRFLRSMVAELSFKDPRRNAIPESYPLLRAIQFGTFFK